MITVEDLLQCGKHINKKRRPEFQIDQRHYRMNIDVECDLQDIKMTMFLRRLNCISRGFYSGTSGRAPKSFC